MGGQNQFSRWHWQVFLYGLEAVYGFVAWHRKKDAKTPSQDLELAKKRRNMVMAGGISDE